jgi:hypothetical protein
MPIYFLGTLVSVVIVLAVFLNVFTMFDVFARRKMKYTCASQERFQKKNKLILHNKYLLTFSGCTHQATGCDGITWR